MTLPADVDDVIAAALAMGRTWEEAGHAAGVSRATVARRMREPAFRGLVSDLRRAAVDQALGRFAAALTDAAARLHLLVDSENGAVALRASVAILELALKYLSHADLEERVRRLEERGGEYSAPSSATTAENTPVVPMATG